VHSSAFALSTCNRKPYPVPARHIAQLRWNTIARLRDVQAEGDPAFAIAGLRIQPLRLQHGGSYIALGFLFGDRGYRVAYLSDVSAIPPCSLVSLVTFECTGASLPLLPAGL
jgi:hypothetical protein